MEDEKVSKGHIIQEGNILKQQLYQLEQELENMKAENLNLETVLDKNAREKKRLVEEVALYKTELSEERAKAYSGRDTEI